VGVISSLPPKVLRAVVAPLQAFFSLEAAGSVVLLGTTLAALAWANSPWGDTYDAVTRATLTLGRFSVTVQELVNEGLMTLFFFVVGLEIKLERVDGQLRETSQVVLPLTAAAGGMVVPAAVYLALNSGGPRAAGWGIPMATDIAFAVGVMRLLGKRLHPALPIFLLALAVFDDIGGIAVIALFYGGQVRVAGLAAAAGGVAAVLLLGRARVAAAAPYLLAGVCLWLALHHGGVHPALAGVLLGLCIPHLPERALLHRFVHWWHPYVVFGVVPLFALCNAGVRVALHPKDLVAPVTLGVFLGLVAGKPLGVLSLTWLLHRVARIPLPGNKPPAQIAALGCVAGIGFTVALFIAQLAFPVGSSHLAQAKLGILLGSALSALLGYVGLRVVAGVAAPQQA
jgi:NhaA family Na+:H+ antiporter